MLELDDPVRTHEPDEQIVQQRLFAGGAVRAGSREAAAIIAVREATIIRRWPEALRWGTCLALALCVHAAGAVALLVQWEDPSDLVANAPVVMVELAPVPVAPEVTPTELPPGPQQAESQPEPEPQRPIEVVEKEREPEPQRPVEKAEIKTEPVKKADVSAMQPPKPVEKPKEKKSKQRHASLASAPSTAEQRDERAAAPTPGVASQNPNALPSWKSALVARLERYKRYPPEAQSHGEQGVVQLAFSVDRSGGVHNAHIARSSGSSSLDRETLTLVQRAAPMPPPPAEVPGARIPIMVPIRYNTR